MDSYFMRVAQTISTKSKDPNTKVGAVIVDGDNKIVSTGYNGMVKGIKEKELWKNKKPYVIHAEMNAALFSRRPDLRGCQVYVTHAPCINCMKHLFQLGVRVIFYESASTKTPLSPSDIGEIFVLLEAMDNVLVKNYKTHQTLQQELISKGEEI